MRYAFIFIKINCCTYELAINTCLSSYANATINVQ